MCRMRGLAWSVVSSLGWLTRRICHEPAMELWNRPSSFFAYGCEGSAQRARVRLHPLPLAASASSQGSFECLPCAFNVFLGVSGLFQRASCFRAIFSQSSAKAVPSMWGRGCWTEQALAPPEALPPTGGRGRSVFPSPWCDICWPRELALLAFCASAYSSYLPLPEKAKD